MSEREINGRSNRTPSTWLRCADSRIVGAWLSAAVFLYPSSTSVVVSLSFLSDRIPRIHEQGTTRQEDRRELRQAK